MLTKKEIVQMIQEKKMEFEPALDQFQVQPNSVDLRVGWNFYVPRVSDFNKEGRIAISDDCLDFNLKKENYKIIRLTEGQYFEILPGEFVIISTLEKIKLNAGDVAATLFARSSAIRRGFIVESGIVDARYDGYLMLPVRNNTWNKIIRIYPGERVCQLIFHRLESELTKEEAEIHGVAKAKYNSSTPYGLEARSDSEEEINFIRGGKIKDLKDQYKIA